MMSHVIGQRPLPDTHISSLCVRTFLKSHAIKTLAYQMHICNFRCVQAIVNVVCREREIQPFQTLQWLSDVKKPWPMRAVYSKYRLSDVNMPRQVRAVHEQCLVYHCLFLLADAILKEHIGVGWLCMSLPDADVV